MHDQQRDNFRSAIDRMSSTDKLELIEQLAHSLRSSSNGQTQAEAVHRQRQAWERLQKELASLPPTKDPYAHLGCSNEAHDKILYDLEQK